MKTLIIMITLVASTRVEAEPIRFSNVLKDFCVNTDRIPFDMCKKLVGDCTYELIKESNMGFFPLPSKPTMLDDNKGKILVQAFNICTDNFKARTSHLGNQEFGSHRE